jgi:lipopolysaccharide transport system ATP-binding protein
MYVRLAFAVAAHMETEVLLVDEVLAVGDAEFQKKCLGKMSELSHHGRTVLFVSHNMSAVKRLCTAGLLLENGRLHSGGNLSDVIAAYSEQFRPQSEVTFQSRPGQPAITRVTIDQQAIKNGDLILEVAFESPFPLNPPIAGVVVSSISGTPVFGSNPRFHPHNFNGGSLASGVSRLIVRSLPLSSGRYRVSVFLGDWQSDYAQKLDVLDFEFRAEQSLSLRPNSENIGHLEWPGEWSLIQAR